MAGDLWTGEQLAGFRRAWEQANTPAARAAHMRRETRRLLPLRTRLRLWRDRQLTSAGIWLLDHAGERACVALWSGSRAMEGAPRDSCRHQG